MQQSSDGELVILARSGYKEAFAELIERYQPMARRIASGVLTNEDLVQEIVQEAFLAAYLSLDQLREPARFRSWLYSIVLNVARAFLKERTQDPLSLESLMGGMHCDLFPSSGALLDPQEIAEERELHHLLLKAVQGLSPKERAATLLFYYEQLSLQEVAAILDISVTAVKSRLFKARNHLRTRLLPISEEAGQAPEPLERKRTMAKVVVSSVRKDFGTGRRVVILWDEVGHRFFIIWVAQSEAMQIALKLTDATTPRPSTLQFMANVMKATGVQLEEVRVEALKDNIYYAVARVCSGEQVSEVDVRPTDAIGLALLMDRPIFAAEDVLEKYGIVTPEGKTAEVFLAEQWLEREGITLPEGKAIQINHDKERERAAVLQEIEEFKERSRRAMTPTAEEREQAKQRYLAFLMGEDA